MSKPKKQGASKSVSSSSGVELPATKPSGDMDVHPGDSTVPDVRVRRIGREPIQTDGDYVLYWMIANRRASWNFSLDRAIQWARSLNKPLLVFEALRTAYRWNSDRFHAFVIEGMIDNLSSFEGSPVMYYPYLEPEDGAGKGALAFLARRACLVVSDDFPCFFLPHMIESARSQIPVRFELVDSNGLYPMRHTTRVFARAHDFRRHLQKQLLPHLAHFPSADPLTDCGLPALDELPRDFTRQWPVADLKSFSTSMDGLRKFPINHSVRRVDYSGGSKAASRTLRAFIENGLPLYDSERNQPEKKISSGLSPWLHFGHVSAHQVFNAVTDTCDWNPGLTAEKATGSNSGWWGASTAVESFLDELVTWRELGFNMCSLREDYDRYDSLPDWAQVTLGEHASDPRPYVYELEQLETGATHDQLWNAAQMQLVTEGRIHNYLRMLWGKKILEWTSSPQVALDYMIELNNRYATDGRNPNSYSGIFWVLGRYDRAWGPERPIFGKIRYMTSENTARKVRVKSYIDHYVNGGRPLFT